jgi:hypothetical protein
MHAIRQVRKTPALKTAFMLLTLIGLKFHTSFVPPGNRYEGLDYRKHKKFRLIIANFQNFAQVISFAGADIMRFLIRITRNGQHTYPCLRFWNTGTGFFA